MATTNPQITLRVTPEMYKWLDRRFRASKHRALTETVREVLDRGRACIEQHQRTDPPAQ